MSTALIMSALGALALTSGIAFAAGEAPPMGMAPEGDLNRAQVEARVTDHFKRMDVDGDGRLTAADRDAAHARMAAMMFDRLDADHDGAISRDEWNAGAARMAAARAEHPARPGLRGRMGMRGAALLGRADEDRDGAVTLAEMRAAALARFDRADANKDGKVTAEERAAARAAMRERPGG
jgi:Ca2+-binding EF-hand superfamily protein